jgi:hypothetical protein
METENNREGIFLLRVYYMVMIDFLMLYVSFLNKNPSQNPQHPNTNIKHWSHSMAL